MNVDRPFLLRARQITCAYVPVGCLAVLTAKVDFETGAWVAGALSLFFAVLTAFLLADRKLPRVHMVPGMLAWGSPSIPFFMLSMGRHWTEATAVWLTVLAASYVVILRRDIVLAVSLVLSLATGWVFVLVGSFDNWRTATVWGVGAMVFTIAYFVVGRLTRMHALSVVAGIGVASIPVGVLALVFDLEPGYGLIACALSAVGLIGSIILKRRSSR